MEEDWMEIFSKKSNKKEESKKMKEEITNTEFNHSIVSLIKPTTVYSYNGLTFYSNQKGLGLTNYEGGLFYMRLMLMKNIVYREITLRTILEYWPIEQHDGKTYYASDELMLEKELLDAIAEIIKYPRVYKPNKKAPVIIVSKLENIAIIIAQVFNTFM